MTDFLRGAAYGRCFLLDPRLRGDDGWRAGMTVQLMDEHVAFQVHSGSHGPPWESIPELRSYAFPRWSVGTRYNFVMPGLIRYPVNYARPVGDTFSTGSPPEFIPGGVRRRRFS